VVHHTLHRLREQLPQQRSHVRTIPLEAALEREEISPFDMR
jgi:hypothetical protein